MGQPGDVTDTKRPSTPLPHRRQQHQPRRDPCQSGKIEFWKGTSERQSGQDREHITGFWRCQDLQRAQFARMKSKPELQTACGELALRANDPVLIFVQKGTQRWKLSRSAGVRLREVASPTVAGESPETPRVARPD